MYCASWPANLGELSQVSLLLCEITICGVCNCASWLSFLDPDHDDSCADEVIQHSDDDLVQSHTYLPRMEAVSDDPTSDADANDFV